jgi:hypothetical protein
MSPTSLITALQPEQTLMFQEAASASDIIAKQHAQP